MKLLVDMNLSPSWIDRLGSHGFEAVHWSTVGSPLDFSAILAATSGLAPSVVQVRRQDLLSDAAVTAIARALEAYSAEVGAGALLSVNEAGTRVRMLPLHRL